MCSRPSASTIRTRTWPRRPGRPPSRPAPSDSVHWDHSEETEYVVAVKPIRLFGDPVLRTAADPVKDFDKELRQLVKDLTDTMIDAPGAGLAAPQLGVGLRVFTYYVDDQLGHLVNPSLELSEEIQ